MDLVCSRVRKVHPAGLREEKEPVRPAKSEKTEEIREKDVPFGSERGKTLFQTREVDEKKKMTVEERSSDSDRGIQKIVGNQMLNHAGV